MIKKAYPPGQVSKRRRGGFSEYAKELREKQKLRHCYGLSEKQFKNYAMQVLERMHNASVKEENPAELLVRVLESRLDNVVYRLGLADSRVQARQLVVHGHFLLNDKPIRRPSALLKKDDRVSIRENSQKSFVRVLPKLKKFVTPSWLVLDRNKVEGKVTGLPTLEEVSPPAEISSIFEYYSR